jgi:hypothetical protein
MPVRNLSDPEFVQLSGWPGRSPMRMRLPPSPCPLTISPGWPASTAPRTALVWPTSCRPCRGSAGFLTTSAPARPPRSIGSPPRLRSARRAPPGCCRLTAAGRAGPGGSTGRRCWPGWVGAAGKTAGGHSSKVTWHGRMVAPGIDTDRVIQRVITRSAASARGVRRTARAGLRSLESVRCGRPGCPPGSQKSRQRPPSSSPATSASRSPRPPASSRSAATAAASSLLSSSRHFARNRASPSAALPGSGQPAGDHRA